MSSSTPPPPLLHRQRYYCHQCDCTVSIPPPDSPDADVLCPLCAGGFVEELLDAPPPPPPPFFPSSFSTFLSSFDLRNPNDLAVFLGPPSPSAPTQFNASNFLHDHISGLLSGGATIQIVVEGSGSGSAGPGAGAGPGGVSLGDYFMGSGLEQLIQQLAENDPNRYGTLPAAKSAVAALPDVAVAADMMAADGGGQCAVCMDDFHLGAAAKQLPCNHVFHKDCILPWLDLHSSCPVCRFELPTDDPGYEHRRGVGGDQRAPPSAAPAAGGTPSPRGAERRFRISLPWPLRAAFGGAQAESSNPSSQDAGSGGDNNANDSHRGYDDLD